MVGATSQRTAPSKSCCITLVCCCSSFTLTSAVTTRLVSSLMFLVPDIKAESFIRRKLTPSSLCPFLGVSRPGTVGPAASFPHPVFLCGDKRSEEPVNEGSHDDNPIAADSDIHCCHEQAAEIRGKFCELYLHSVSYNQKQEGKAQKHNFIGKMARHPWRTDHSRLG